MIDTVQIVLLTVIIVLAFLLLILGFQVFFILRDIRRTIKKANKVLDDTGSITQSVVRPLTSVSSLIEHMSTGTLVAKLIKIALNAVRKDEEKEGEEKKDGGKQ